MEQDENKTGRENHTVEVVRRRLDGQLIAIDEDGELWLMKKVEV